MEGWPDAYDTVRFLFQALLLLIAAMLIIWLVSTAAQRDHEHERALNQCIVAHKELLNAKEYCIALSNLGGGR